MTDHAVWLDANTRYMSAAVGWIRSLLQERAKKPDAAMSPPPPKRVEPPSSWWRFATLQPQQPAIAAPPPQLAIETGKDEPAGSSAMRSVESGMKPPPALVVLTQRLGLSEFERSTLLLCVAVELDTSIAGLCARAQGDPGRPYPTFALALTLFGEPAWDALSPERPLRRWRLLDVAQPDAAPLTVSPLRADERIVNFLKGVTYVDDRLAPLLAPLPETAENAPPSQTAAAERLVDQVGAASDDQVPPIQLIGRDPASKQVVAGLVCRSLGLRAYRLDWRLIPTSPSEVGTLGRLWQRESLLLPVALYLDTDGSDAAQTASVDLLLSQLTGVVFIATRSRRPGSSTTPIAAEIEKPTEAEQRDCWLAAPGALAETLADSLAGQFSLNAATISELVHRATAGPHADPATLGDRLWEACRTLTRPLLDALAQRVEPRATWDDIVLPEEEAALLHQIADQVGQRSTVYRRWGFAERMSRGLGISVLFAGASGCGKTMAAEVMANDLRLDLFRIDLSAVVSKYIGETEANLRRLFDAAEDGGAILFFDEADALFGKRTEVKDSHDRYANIEINYLLQRMETYAGLAILATNMKSALDQAFLRRLRFVVDFPFPGAAERRVIWQKAFPPNTPTAALDFDRLARLNVTGGAIAVIALNAAFSAARAGTPVTMATVLDAARIEFHKLGHPINEIDFRQVGRAGAVA